MLVKVLLAPRPDWCDCETAPDPRDVVWRNIAVPQAQVWLAGTVLGGGVVEGGVVVEGCVLLRGGQEDRLADRQTDTQTHRQTKQAEETRIPGSA